jgi:hypothetical protein
MVYGPLKERQIMADDDSGGKDGGEEKSETDAIISPL